MIIIPKKVNRSKERLAYVFSQQIQKFDKEARGMGHTPETIHDDATEAAFYCDVCGLWGNVSVYPPRQREDNYYGGSLLTVRCEKDAYRRVFSQQAREMGDNISLSSMFRALGFEPKEVRKDDLLPTRPSRRRSWEWNGRKREQE